MVSSTTRSSANLRNGIYKLFIVFTSLALLAHQFLQKYLEIHLSLLDNYLDPFCLGVIVTFLYQLQNRWLFDRLELSLLELIILVIVLSLISEVLFPYLSDQFVTDWWDVVAIAIGGFISYTIRSRRSS
jgi:hypothetical protein